MEWSHLSMTHFTAATGAKHFLWKHNETAFLLL